MDVNTILAPFAEHDLEQLSLHCREAAVNDDSSNCSKGLSQEEWSLLADIIEDALWKQPWPRETKIGLGFELYERFPAYSPSLLPFYHLVRDERIVYPETKPGQSMIERFLGPKSRPETVPETEMIWKRFAHYLAGPPYLADPVCSLLWLEMFEDQETVEDAWNGMVTYCSGSTAIRRLLNIAGPVPYSLKEPFYLACLKELQYHEAILESLVRCIEDVYGQIDKEKAAGLLQKLQVDASSDSYQFVAKSLTPCKEIQIFNEMHVKALQTDAAGAVGCLGYVIGCHPFGSKLEAGSPLDRIVERERAIAELGIIAYLRTKTGEDLGYNPDAWIQKYAKR
jgi:hypothetical protein